MKKQMVLPFLLVPTLVAVACGGNPELMTAEDAGAGKQDAGQPGGSPDAGLPMQDPSIPMPNRPGEEPPGVPPGLIGAGVFPSVAHSGFDGMHTYQVLFTRPSNGPVTWSIMPSDAATIRTSTAGMDKGFSAAILTTRKVGTFQVTSDADGQQLSALLEVKTYTPEQVEIGKTRYRDPAGMGKRLACAFCHESAGGVRHNPLALAYFDDASVLAVVLTGNYPGGQGMIFGIPHQWELTDAERAAIVPYLRSLPVSVPF